MPFDLTPQRSQWACLIAAWLVALIATLGALFVGEVMGQTPCTLCWHQRAFMFPLAVILTIAAFRDDRGIWRYALPLALGGLAIAGYHTLLYAWLIDEAITPCSRGIPCSGVNMLLFGLIPLPLLSLAAFAAIGLFLLLSRTRKNP